MNVDFASIVGKLSSVDAEHFVAMTKRGGFAYIL